MLRSQSKITRSVPEYLRAQKNEGQTIWIWRPQWLNEKLRKKLAVEQAYARKHSL